MSQTGNTSAILVMEAFEHVHPDRCAEYEAAGVEIDDRVRESEPGMLVHALTRVRETDRAVTYRWLEIFENADALAAHFDNPAVKAHVARLGEGILVAPTELVLYTGWSEAEQAEWRERLGGAPLTFAPVLAGYYLER